MFTFTTAKQVISCHGKNEKVCEMSKNEKRTCKACKTIVFHYQICNFLTLLLPSSRDEVDSIYQALFAAILVKHVIREKRNIPEYNKSKKPLVTLTMVVK